MIAVRKANDRGHADHGWLNTRHTFSFAGYRDPEQMGFRSLRVINEDRVAPGKGFGTHAHENMEIISYVLFGALQHKDSMGNGEVLRPGEFQLISAGSGITHSEFNPAADEPVHFYQIWLVPDEENSEPHYDQRACAVNGGLQLVASPDGQDDSFRIHADAKVYHSSLTDKDSLDYAIQSGRYGWLQILAGNVSVNGVELSTSDGAAISEESKITINASSDAEIMLFDLA